MHKVFKKNNILIYCVATFILAVLVLAVFQKQVDEDLMDMNQRDESITSDIRSTGGLSFIADLVPTKSNNNKEEMDALETNKIVTLNKLMGWIYPGSPACSASLEIADGRRIDVIKPEYFRVIYSGEMILLDEETHGCNGYSNENVALLKEYSSEQFVTISSAGTQAMDVFLSQDLLTGQHADRLVSFVQENGLTGIELDFEDYGTWTTETYDKYKMFVTNLGTALHENGKKLMIDGPPIASSENQSWYKWEYKDFVNLPVDYVLVMAYDYQFDHGAGVPVAPLNWIKDVISWTQSEFPYSERLVIGLPTYGYTGELGTNSPTLITYQQAKNYAGFSTATRDEESAEMFWINNSNYYSYQDVQSIDQKINLVLEAGIGNISIWHLGGNEWPSR